MEESEKDLCAVLQGLWDHDVNRLQPGKDYSISLQGRAGDAVTTNGDNDTAYSPLFLFVNEEIFQKETFLAFISLLDNYESDTGEPEVVTPEEIAENHRFLDAVMDTAVMKITHEYLAERKLSPTDTKEFKRQLYHIWFELYARKGSSRPDSSGFEHVFVGETRGSHTVIGFHNWIQLYLQERLGHIDYRGYSLDADSPEFYGTFSTSQKFEHAKLPTMEADRVSHYMTWPPGPNTVAMILEEFDQRVKENQPDENKHMLSLQFSWKNGIKPKGSIFMGVSPEFEFAMYTLCFLSSRHERLRVSFSLYEVDIVCHHHNHMHIGTTYPVLIRYRST